MENLQVLTTSEMQAVDGGFAPVVLYLAGVAVGTAVGTMVGFAVTHAILN